MTDYGIYSNFDFILLVFLFQTSFCCRMKTIRCMLLFNIIVMTVINGEYIVYVDEWHECSVLLLLVVLCVIVTPRVA